LHFVKCDQRSPAPRIDLYTTAITEAEIFYGIELLEDGTRRQKLLLAAESLFDIDLKDRVIDFDGDARESSPRLPPIAVCKASLSAIQMRRPPPSCNYTAPRLRLAMLQISGTAGSK
jgi:hypothetical protein